VISFTLRPLYHYEKQPWYTILRRWMEHRDALDARRFADDRILEWTWILFLVIVHLELYKLRIHRGLEDRKIVVRYLARSWELSLLHRIHTDWDAHTFQRSGAMGCTHLHKTNRLLYPEDGGIISLQNETTRHHIPGNNMHHRKPCQSIKYQKQKNSKHNTPYVGPTESSACTLDTRTLPA
jgi:hypothetical protein